jgi:thiamine-phosphate pyrophosphorylase
MPDHPTKPLDLSIYLVTDTVMCGQFGVAATVSAAVGAGATLVQLRDENATDDELVSLGREINAVLAGTEVPLLVNDRVHLVEPMGAHGAHVGQSDLGIGQARALLGRAAYLGLSVETLEQVAAARDQADGTLDYIGVGPVWATTTKLDAAAPSGLDRLRQIVSASPWPCVGIGGINLERVREVRRAGAAGAALVSAICGQPDVAAATRALRVAWDESST